MLDLFSGIGGFSLGLEAAGMQTVAFCEVDKYCQQVLRKRWPEVPIHGDIKTLDAEAYAGSVDVICGGYPCQPFSVAGKQLGEQDERHLWPEMLRVIQAIRPRWVIAENVAGHIRLGFDTVAAQMEAEGFTVWPFVIPACAVGGQHRRDRLWIIANAKGHRDYRTPKSTGGSSKGQDGNQAEQLAEHGEVQSMAYTSSIRCERWGTTGNMAGEAGASEANGKQWKRNGCAVDDRSANVAYSNEQRSQGWYLQPECADKLPAWAGGMAGQPKTVTEWTEAGEVERNFRGMAYGVSRRMDRLRALGNAVVPQIPYLIGKAIMGHEYSLAA